MIQDLFSSQFYNVLLGLYKMYFAFVMKCRYKKNTTFKDTKLSLYAHNLEKWQLYSTVTAWNHTTRLQQSSSAGLICASVICLILAVFASAVEASVQETDPLFHVVSVQSHHSVSDHPLLSNQSLQFIPFETLHPAGGPYEVFGMSFKITCRHKNHKSKRKFRYSKHEPTQECCHSTRHTWTVLMVHGTYLVYLCYHTLQTCSSSQSTCLPSSAQGRCASWSGSMSLNTAHCSKSILDNCWWHIILNLVHCLSVISRQQILTLTS